MIPAEEKKIIKHAVTCFGIKPQTVKAIEELGELSTELARNLNGRDNRYAMAGEISDVLIMIEQLVEYHGLADMVAECKVLKLQSLAHLLNLDADDNC